jgi:hypothetical protein
MNGLALFQYNRRLFLKQTAVMLSTTAVFGCARRVQKPTLRSSVESEDDLTGKAIPGTNMPKDTIYIGDPKPKDPTKVLRLSDLEGRYTKGECWDSHQHVMGPGHLLARQRELDAWKSDLAKYDPRQSMCFVFGGGEDSNDRVSTRVGGLPFWPKDRPWPKAQDGTPKQFLGQFDFRNIIWPQPLPGDVLTVHWDEDWDGDGRFSGPADGAAATLVWHDSQKIGQLIGRQDLPPPPKWFSDPGPFYGMPVLVTDYKNKLSETSFVLTIHGMKIGGHSQFYGNNWQRDIAALKIPVFLCSMGYITPYCYVKERRAWLPPKPGFDPKKAHELMFLDVGVLVIAYEKGNPSNLRWVSYLP